MTEALPIQLLNSDSTGSDTNDTVSVSVTNTVVGWYYYALSFPEEKDSVNITVCVSVLFVVGVVGVVAAVVVHLLFVRELSLLKSFPVFFLLFCLVASVARWSIVCGVRRHTNHSNTITVRRRCSQ